VEPGCLRATRFSAANEILSSWIRLQRTPRRARVERARASSVSSPGRARTDHTRCLDDDRHALRTRSAFGSFAKPNNAEFSTTRRAASAVDAPSASSCTPRSSPRPTLRETEPTLRPR
jgi:hypothetical protein